MKENTGEGRLGLCVKCNLTETEESERMTAKAGGV